MVKKKIAESTKEFDRRFDNGEDIHDLIDILRGAQNRLHSLNSWLP